MIAKNRMLPDTEFEFCCAFSKASDISCGKIVRWKVLILQWAYLNP